MTKVEITNTIGTEIISLTMRLSPYNIKMKRIVIIIFNDVTLTVGEKQTTQLQFFNKVGRSIEIAVTLTLARAVILIQCENALQLLLVSELIKMQTTSGIINNIRMY